MRSDPISFLREWVYAATKEFVRCRVPVAIEVLEVVWQAVATSLWQAEKTGREAILARPVPPRSLAAVGFAGQEARLAMTIEAITKTSLQIGLAKKKPDLDELRKAVRNNAAAVGAPPALANMMARFLAPYILESRLYETVGGALKEKRILYVQGTPVPLDPENVDSFLKDKKFYLVLDQLVAKLFINQEELKMKSKIQFRALGYLLKKHKQLCSHKELYEYAWQTEIQEVTSKHKADLYQTVYHVQRIPGMPKGAIETRERMGYLIGDGLQDFCLISDEFVYITQEKQ